MQQKWSKKERVKKGNHGYYGHQTSYIQPKLVPQELRKKPNLQKPYPNGTKIENECLASVEVFNNFEQWLLGKPSITVHTDHQSIFQKDLASAPKRLQKMMLFLQRYSFTVVLRKRFFVTLSG